LYLNAAQSIVRWLALPCVSREAIASSACLIVRLLPGLKLPKYTAAGATDNGNGVSRTRDFNSTVGMAFGNFTYEKRSLLK
jgi:hypothetical protein